MLTSLFIFPVFFKTATELMELIARRKGRSSSLFDGPVQTEVRTAAGKAKYILPPDTIPRSVLIPHPDQPWEHTLNPAWLS